MVCYTNHSLTMVNVVKLWLYSQHTKKQTNNNNKTWLLHFYYNKTVINFRKGHSTEFALSLT